MRPFLRLLLLLPVGLVLHTLIPETEPGVVAVQASAPVTETTIAPTTLLDEFDAFLAANTTTTTVKPKAKPKSRPKPQAPAPQSHVTAAQAGTPALPGIFLPVEYDHNCGNGLPPCGTLANESGGNIRLWNKGRCKETVYYPVGWTGPNRCGSTASGKWQFLRSTWNNYCYEGICYVNAADAPAHVQDAKAREVWANGQGCGNWSAC